MAALRIRRGLTQTQLAELAGVSTRALATLERGQTANPSVRFLSNLAAVLGCTVDDLLEDDWRWTQFAEGRPATPPDRATIDVVRGLSLRRRP